jgi:ABC-2 type transport system permease protein
MHADGRRRVRDLLQAPWQRERVEEPQLQRRRHVVVSALLQGELLKLRTTRTFTALTAVAAGTSLLLIVLDTTLFRENFDETTVRQLLTSEITGLFILVLGVMGMTGEWRHRTITSSVLAAPNRLRLLGAKLTSYAIAGALLSLIVTVMIMLVGTIILSLRNKTTLDIAALLDVLWRNLTVAAYYGAIGVCLGALLRNQAAALVGVLMSASSSSRPCSSRCRRLGASPRSWSHRTDLSAMTRPTPRAFPVATTRCSPRSAESSCSDGSQRCTPSPACCYGDAI